jgi:hypothetical protein
MSIIEIRVVIHQQITGNIGRYLRGIALNAGLQRTEGKGLDIRIAKESGYIIADASGVSGSC